VLSGRNKTGWAVIAFVAFSVFNQRMGS